MMNVFNGQILSEKLSKLNNSQQSIETLSHWCIYHRKKAKQVVETWDKLFHSSQREQRIPFLYLANDILQNSRRKGSEFVNEFWKVLPGALKDVSENGDDYGKNVVTRLVDIWEERKVFGSRRKSIKDEMLGKDPPSLLESNGKSSQSQSIKIVKKDAHSIRLKLAVGGMPEKIITAFQSVHDEHSNEDTALMKSNAAVHCVGKMKKDVEDACMHGNQQGSTLGNELQEQETILRQCIEQLGNVEATRVTLDSQLKEALQENASKLELIRTQKQVAQAQVQQASGMKLKLSSGPVPGSGPTTTTSPTETATAAESNPPPSQTIHTPQPPPLQPLTSFANSKTTTDEENKRAAAAVAAKLTASTSSAQMLTSILSSLAAEEAASMNGGLNASSFTTSFPIQPPDKRPKLEKPMPVSDIGSGYFTPIQPHQQLGPLPLPPAQASAGMQPMSQTNQQQPLFSPPPPPLPPPLHMQQPYVQSGAMAGAGTVSYGYGGSSLPPPPPPPLPNHMLMGLARPAAQQQQLPQPQQQQHSAPPGYYQSPGIGFYGQSHPPTSSPVPRP